ncbi:MAG: tryptophan-rich sensory protein [Candidatus Omnitrophica bacterium]|nr:tryptophan-rich sensory protein [Candidatus Omnitrophota bacterium]
MTLFIFIAICLLAGYIGSRFTFVSVKTWYPTIKKPSWNPPNWIFAPVWTLLYILMAVAAWKVWETADNAFGPMLIFAVQLVLNVAWSAIFFGKRNISLAFKEIILLWITVVATTAVFWSVDHFAGILFLPYVAWVTFAAFLNYTIDRMNK